MKIEDIEKYGKQAQGRNELIRFLNGDELTRKQAMISKCYECCQGYADGLRDCKVKTCPLYGYMPFNKNRYHKEMTEEQKRALVGRMGNRLR